MTFLYTSNSASRTGIRVLATASIAVLLTMTTQSAALGCSMYGGSSMTIVPEVGSCFYLVGSDMTLHMSLNSCLVQDEKNPIRFHVIACDEAATGSCKTDLDGGTVIYYEERGNEVVQSTKPCSENQ